MPRYLVTNGSNFQPFTYDELSRPLYEMAAAHNAAQDQYDTLSTETSALKRYISDNPGDKQAKELYDSYVNKLNSLQENLWNNGYTATTRRDLSQARSGYASDISRLGVAIKNRQDRSAEYWKTKHDHPDMIMGDDPGASGLDNYLNDDMYGTNWYHYSGNQFMTEVGADAKARANELVRDPQIMNDPRLAGYITRITQDGFTSTEVANASAAVKAMLNGDVSLMQSLDPASAILADVLTSHLESTGAAGKVSASEFERLFDYGRAGLSQAIGKTDIKDMSDKVWDFNKQIALQNHAHALSEASAARRAAASGGGSGTGNGKEDLGEHTEDTETTSGSNPGARKARMKLDKLFGPDTVRITSMGGTQVRGGAEASELVYSGDLRRKAYKELGFDIGRDLTHLASKNFITGEIERNGVVYETQYNPRANGGQGAVKIREKGSNTPWNYAKNDVELTNRFDRYRLQYEDTLDYYKKYDPDIFNMATVDPDKQHKLYEQDGYNFNTSLTDYRNTVFNTPQYQDVVPLRRTWVAQGATDSGGYIGKIAELISSNIDEDRRNGKIKEWGAYDTQSGHIHEINSAGILDKNSIVKPGTIFDYDKDGTIKGVTGIQLDENAILNDYIIVNKSTKRYGIGIDMMRSDMIHGLFQEARETMMKVLYNPMYTSEQRQQYVDEIVAMTSKELKDILGYRTNTQSQGGSSQENRN